MTLLYGCETLNKEECQVADWYLLGSGDGADGRLSKLDRHIRACQKHGVQPSVDQYNSGYSDGLKEYCTYENGVNEGANGRKYNKVCQGAAHTAFYAGYLPYYNVTHTKAELGATKRAIQSNENRLREENIDEKEKLRLFGQLTVDKSSVNGLERDLFKYEYQLVMHEIDREIDQLTRRLKYKSTTSVARDDMLKELSELQELRKSETVNYKLGRAARNIKDIKRLFD